MFVLALFLCGAGLCQGAMIRLAPNSTQWKMTVQQHVYAQTTGSRIPISFTIQALPLSDTLHAYQVSVATVPASVGMDWCNTDYDANGAPLSTTCLPSQTSAGVAIPVVAVVDVGATATWTADTMAALQLTLSTGASIGIGLGLTTGVAVVLSVVIVLAFRE